MSPFARLRTLDDPSLLRAVREMYVPGALEPDLGEICRALAGREVSVPVPGGAVRVDLGDWTSILLIRLGAWEPHLARLAAALVEPGHVAVDVGAHVGTWTLLLASLVGECGRVVAFEPSPQSAARASVAVMAAGFGDRTRIVEAAVGDRCGHARLYAFAAGARYAGADSMLRSLVLTDGYDEHTAVEVRLTTLDAAGLDRVDFLKVDTEGFELAVLRGGRALLGRSDPTLLVELHAEELAAQGSSPAHVFGELDAQGFTVLDLRPEDGALVARPLAAGGTPATNHVLARRDSSPFEVSLIA